MKLLKNEKTEEYHEIEVEHIFFWHKYVNKYRKIKGNIYKFNPPNTYINLTLGERINIEGLFNITVNND